MPGPDAGGDARSGGALLALETATRRGSVALLRGGEPVTERSLPEDRSTSEALLPAIDALLAEAGLRVAELSGFAVSIGPGSFTGLRIGVATLKGLLFGSREPVAAVPSLAALAAGAPPGPGPVVALLDAQRGCVYAAGYAEPGRDEPEVLPEGLYAADALARRLPAVCRLVGEGVAVCGEALVRARGPGVALAAELAAPRAADVARLGARLLAEGRGIPAEALAPRYVRRAEAEARRTGRPTEPL